MRKAFLLIAFFFIIISSCRKNGADQNELIGSWRLTEVYDKNTSTTNYPPVGASTDIVITFLVVNKFSGHTLRNSFSNGTFTLNSNQITFGSFYMTKIAEDQWGSSFLTVLHACGLQSLSPCAPSEVTIQGNIMKIETPLRYNITLERI